MNNVLYQIDSLADKLKALRPLPKDYQLKLDKKFRLEFNFNSNHMEGNTLTYGETKLLLFFDDTKGNHTMREYEEMKAHDLALKLVEELAADKERPLTEQFIKMLNETILVRPFWKEAITEDGQATRKKILVGDYKQTPNSVRLPNGEMHHYSSVADTPIQMQELMDWYKMGVENGEHPLILAALFHYKFVCIHPFDDGNGRLARLLMNYVLLKNDLPPIVIKSVDKANYLRALHRADAGEIDAIVSYLVEQMRWSLEISLKAAKGEDIDEQGDLDKKLVSLKQKLGHKNEKLKLKHGLKAVVDTLNGLRPLIDEYEMKLKEFDPFFYSRDNLVSVPNLALKGTDLYDTYDSVLKKCLGEGVLNEENIPLEMTIDFKSIKLNVGFKRLRNSNEEKSFNGGEIIVNFYDNLYEIKLIEKEQSYTFLYDEELTGDLVSEIVEYLGNWLYRIIEKEIGN